MAFFCNKYFGLYLKFVKNNNVKFVVWFAFMVFGLNCTIINNSIANETNPYTINLTKENNQKVFLSEITEKNGNLLEKTSLEKASKYIFIENDLIYNKSIIKLYNKEVNNSFFDINNFSTKNVNLNNFYIDNNLNKLQLIKSQELLGFQILGLIHQSKRYGYYLFLTGEGNNYCLTRLDKNLKLISNQKILQRTQSLTDNVKFKITKDCDLNNLFILIENSLISVDYAAENIAFEIIDNNVVQISDNSLNNLLVYAKENGNFLNLISLNNNIKSELTKIDFGYNIKIALEETKENSNLNIKNNLEKNTYCYVLNGFANSVLLNIIRFKNFKNNSLNNELEKPKVSKKWLNGNIKDYNFIIFKNEINLLNFSFEDSKQNVIISKFVDVKNSQNTNDINNNNQIYKSLELVSKYENDYKFSEVIDIHIYDNKLLVVTHNSLLLFSLDLNNSDLTLLAKDYFNINLQSLTQFLTTENQNNENIYLQYYENEIVINFENKSYIFELSRNNFWYFSRLYNDVGKYILPFVIILILFVFYRKNRKNQRLIRNLLELPGAGFILVFDKDGNLTIANNTSRDILRLDYNIPMNKYFKFYCDNELSLPLFDFFQKAFETKNNLTQRVNLIIDNKVREYYCNTMVLRNVAGNFRGLIISGIDITEELERQRLINWAQLAHDLQTNLSIIKLNAENLESLVSIADKPRVEKISQQANIIFHRIRDLVTVGSSRVLNKFSYKTSELVDEVIGEFDLSLIPNINITKSIKNFDVFCDKPKLIRCIRNATENSIKILKQSGGEIQIKCYLEDKYAVFVVEDNGPGMDEDIKKRMLSPFFTTNQDDGGSGIGTMIMLNVMEQHGGKLLVESEKGKGTKMIFRFPNVKM